MISQTEYHWEYYLRNRAARLAYQKAYDAAHKEEKRARMQKYRQRWRHGYLPFMWYGLPGTAIELPANDNREAAFKRRNWTLAKDADYRCAKAHRKWPAKHPEEAAKTAAKEEAQHWRDLKLQRTGKWNPFKSLEKLLEIPEGTADLRVVSGTR